MTKFMTSLAVFLAAVLSLVACDQGATTNQPDTTTVPDANVQPDTTPDTTTVPDANVQPDTTPTEDYCATIRAANICRTWQAFQYNGDPESGEIHVTCENSADPDFPNTCAVRQTNDHVFYLLDTTFYGTSIPTEDEPLELKGGGNVAMLWVEGLSTLEPTLHIYLKKADNQEHVILSR